MVGTYGLVYIKRSAWQSNHNTRHPTSSISSKQFISIKPDGILNHTDSPTMPSFIAIVVLGLVLKNACTISALPVKRQIGQIDQITSDIGWCHQFRALDNRANLLHNLSLKPSSSHRYNGSTKLINATCKLAATYSLLRSQNTDNSTTNNSSLQSDLNKYLQHLCNKVVRIHNY